MLSSTDLERLIAMKRREIESEKTQLGLKTTGDTESTIPQTPNTTPVKPKSAHSVHFQSAKFQQFHDSPNDCDEKKNHDQGPETPDGSIPPELERYIRRYLGLPVMLRAGEYSPNNPLVRPPADAFAADDIFRGLGEYERRSQVYRRLRQTEYRRSLEQQTKLKEESKKQEKKELLEKEDREKERELYLQERDRERAVLERESRIVKHEWKRDSNAKVDTATQVEPGRHTSVGVQTDDSVLFDLPSRTSPKTSPRTKAERELSPRTVVDHAYDNRPIESREYYDDHFSPVKRNKERLQRDLRHTYMPSIFDENAIQMRNMKVEQEAVAKKQYYQQELRNQILEQQRIKEERKAREKMLEAAELRRLEEQLKMLKLSQEKEGERNHLINVAIQENAKEYDVKRRTLLEEIDFEKRNLRNVRKKPFSILPKEKNYSTNISENSVFSPNYDVDGYLRLNLNPPKSERPKYEPSFLRKDINELIARDFKKPDFDEVIPVLKYSSKVTSERGIDRSEGNFGKSGDGVKIGKSEGNFGKRGDGVNIGKTSEGNFGKSGDGVNIGKSEGNFGKSGEGVKIGKSEGNFGKISDGAKGAGDISDGMRKVEDKWQVPVVQKNILKTLPSSDGKNLNVLTQLGSIRRQLQLEQLKLDQMGDK